MKRSFAAVVALAILGAASPVRADRVLRFGTLPPEGSTYMEDLEGIARDVERLSDGELKIKWIGGGALGDDREMAKLMTEGKLDGGGFTDAGLTYIVSEMSMWGLPGLFEDYAEIDYIEKKFKKRFDAKFAEKDVVLLMWADVGFLHVFSNEPVTSLDDLREHELWMWTDDPSGTWAMKELGVKTTITSLGDLSKGLKDGSVDTYQYPPLAAIAWGLHPYSKYISELRYRFMVGAVVVRRDVFEELPKDQQRLLKSVGRKWERRIIKSWRAEGKKALKALKKGGMKTVKVGEAARKEYFRATREIQAAFSKRFGVESLFGDVAHSLREFRDANKSR